MTCPSECLCACVGEMTTLLPELNRETEADVSIAGLAERKSDNEGLTLETSASFFLGWKFDPYSLS